MIYTEKKTTFVYQTKTNYCKQCLDEYSFVKKKLGNVRGSL